MIKSSSTAHRALRCVGRSPFHPCSALLRGGEEGGGGGGVLVGGSTPPLMKPLPLLRGLSTAPPGNSTPNSSSPSDDNNSDKTGAIPRPPQAFANTRFYPGEWDPDMTDPLYRPKFATSAKILSADDFRARPKVGTSIEFNDFTEAMTVPSWLTQREQKNMYAMYTEIILHSAQAHNGVTSHEYAVRAVANRFRLTQERVAGVILLQHEEEQLKRQGVKLADDVADYMDTELQRELVAAYQTFGQRPPDSFVEDVVPPDARPPHRSWRATEDVTSVEQIWPATQVAENQRAQAYLDNYVYEIDTPDTDIDVPLDKDAKDLLRQAKKLHTEQQKEFEAKGFTQPKKGRARWKYVAQTVNTRHRKQQIHKEKQRHVYPPATHTGKDRHIKNSTSYVNDYPRNTLVHQDPSVEESNEAAAATLTASETPTLRAANAEEVAGMAWKSARHSPIKFMYASVQKAWLAKHKYNQDDAWGKAPAPPSPPPSESPTANGVGEETVIAADNDTDPSTTEAIDIENNMEEETVSTSSTHDDVDAAANEAANQDNDASVAEAEKPDGDKEE